MLPYCLKCKKGANSVDSKTKNVRPMLPSKCAVCDNKKSKELQKRMKM